MQNAMMKKIFFYVTMDKRLCRVVVKPFREVKIHLQVLQA